MWLAYKNNDDVSSQKAMVSFDVCIEPKVDDVDEYVDGYCAGLP